MAKPPDTPPKEFPSRREETTPREAGPRRERDWYAGRSGSRVSVEITSTSPRREGGGYAGRFGEGRFGDDRPPRTSLSRFGDRPPREPGHYAARPPRENHPPIDWEKWEAELEAALKARNGEG